MYCTSKGNVAEKTFSSNQRVWLEKTKTKTKEKTKGAHTLQTQGVTAKVTKKSTGLWPQFC